MKLPSKQMLKKMINDGMTQKEIALLYNCSRQAVHWKLHSEKKARVGKIDWHLVCKLKNKGLTDQDVADVIGVNRVSICKSKYMYLEHSTYIDSSEKCEACSGTGTIETHKKFWALRDKQRSK